MADDGLARRVRDYARARAGVLVAVSSAWLAREFAVDPRTIAAALRPYGIRPAVVEPGVRGYVVAELAAIRFDDDPVKYCAICNQPQDPAIARCHPVGALLDWPVIPLSSLLTVDEKALVRSAGADLDNLVVGFRPDPDAEPDAVARLSAGAGHDMTPALRAAGLL